MINLRVCAAAALLLPLLSACGGGGEPAQPTPSPSTSQLSTTGSAVLDSAAGQQQFTLLSCTATSDGSVEASGDNGTYSIAISVQSGTGEVLMANQSDLQDTIEGIVDTVKVAADGTFQIDGTYQNPQGEQKVSVSGQCGA
jgi:hypothetical protein